MRGGAPLSSGANTRNGGQVSAFPLRSIAVVGGGAGGWLAAATLRHVLGDSCAVRLLELTDDNAIHGAVETVPSLHRLLRLLRLDEIMLMRATQATFRLGAQFRDWTAEGAGYFHGFGSSGAKLDAVSFQHHWLRLACLGDSAPFEDFSVAAQAAKLGRFALPQSDPRSVLSLYSYAWHFDADLLAAHLRGHALRNGVTVIAGDIANVQLDEQGSIRALALDNGERLEAEMYVDCGGERGVLRTALGIELDDWSAWLPCDRTQTLRCAADPSLPPYSCATADPHGWQLRVPLQQCSVLSHVYCSEFIGDDAVRDKLLVAAGVEAQGAPRTRRLMRGRPRQFWVRNCVLLPGDALDPLESTGLHLMQTGITRFLAHLPARLPGPAETREYNRLTAEEYDRIRDLLVLHYHANARQDSLLWKRCRETAVPETLSRRLALFTDSGRITVGEDEHCGVDGWLAVLLGQGVRPRSYDPLAEVTPLPTVRTALSRLREEIRAQAAALPSHRNFIALRGVTAQPSSQA